MAGIESVYYADIRNVEHVIPYSDGVVVSLKSGHSWQEIEADSTKAGSGPEEGHAYRHRVTMLYHGSQQEVVRTLDEMAQGRFLVKAVDNNGTEWLYGCEDCPLRMSFESSNDGEPDGTTAYELSFEGVCPLPEMRMY